MNTRISCEEVMDGVSSYIEREDSAERRAAVEEHICWCRRCRVVFDSTEKMLKLLVAAEPYEVPLDVSARLYTRLGRFLHQNGD